MYSLPPDVAAWNCMVRIEPPDLVKLLRPIQRFFRVEGERPAIAQSLRFGQIGLAASKRLLRLFLLGDVPPDTAVTCKPCRLVEHRQSRDGHETFSAISCRTREH